MVKPASLRSMALASILLSQVVELVKVARLYLLPALASLHQGEVCVDFVLGVASWFTPSVC